ncbi:stage V sporulation protein AC [Anaerotignum lactatifermentans]|uniref:Stage V sporulation protein AC n=2 Tax=Anaerotignum lactatifermentans TaxID=160404 RepID=A0ABS2G7W2_9FIRM|nr:stage V sporulation protein AC [Anaerotignum lactatifermentans]MBM6877561.1 stage V sporulation protein AC [Anaerotignum lactatifermentans]MBM6950777.1 stage V sporulation protein AC [Anaerotignum lactatifermentans]
MVEEVSPKSPIVKNCILAFLSGGAICTLGQAFRHWYLSMAMTEEECGLMVSVTLIGISAVLTALGIYGRLGKHCGAGTEVPITGFANSVVSPAIEFKKEGLVLGMAAKMFLIAGPVIVYGTLTSVIVGLIYFLLGR